MRPMVPDRHRRPPHGRRGHPGYDSRPRGRGGERRAATRVGGAAAQGRRRRRGYRRRLHVRRHRLARADLLRPPAPRRAGDAHAGAGARPGRRAPVAADRHVPVLRRPRARGRRLEHRGGDRVPRARLGADLPGERRPRAPARAAEADRMAAARRRRAAGDLDDSPSVGTTLAISDFLGGYYRTVDAASDISSSGLGLFAQLLGLPGARWPWRSRSSSSR